MMASNYPPGVTGDEYEIAGPDYERETDEPCENCGEIASLEQGYGGERWTLCGECGHVSDLPPFERDPDEERDRAGER